MCGPAAEAPFTGVAIADQPGSADDLRMAEAALSYLGGDFDLGSVIPFSELLIEVEWQTIQQLAAHLVARRELDYAQVMALIESM